MDGVACGNDEFVGWDLRVGGAGCDGPVRGLLMGAGKELLSIKLLKSYQKQGWDSGWTTGYPRWMWTTEGLPGR